MIIYDENTQELVIPRGLGNVPEETIDIPVED